MDAGLVDPSYLASDSVASVGWEGHDQRGILRELLMSPVCMNFNVAGSSSVKLSGEDDGFDLEVRDAWVEIHLNDEPDSLLNSLNAWREKITAG